MGSSDLDHHTIKQMEQIKLAINWQGIITYVVMHGAFKSQGGLLSFVIIVYFVWLCFMHFLGCENTEVPRISFSPKEQREGLEVVVFEIYLLNENKFYKHNTHITKENATIILQKGMAIEYLKALEEGGELHGKTVYLALRFQLVSGVNLLPLVLDVCLLVFLLWILSQNISLSWDNSQFLVGPATFPPIFIHE
ncbi:hypothetical protein ACJX0J_017679, partial [Zea mays]